MTDVPPLPADPLAVGDAGQKVIRGSGMRGIGHIVGLLAGLVSAPLVVRHLGTVGYGQFASVQSLMFVVTALVEGGLANVAVRSYANGDDATRRRLISNLLGLRIALVVAGVALAVLYAAVAGFQGTLVAGTAISGFALLLASYGHTAGIPLTAELRLREVATLDLVRSLLTAAGQVTLVLLAASLLPFFAVAGLAAVVSLGMTARWVRGGISLRPTMQLGAWRELLRESGTYAAATALGSIYFQVALQSVKLLSDDVQVGHYAIAFRIVDLANGIPWLLAGSGFPVLARAAETDPERLRYALGRMVEVALLLGVGLTIAMVLGAKVGIDLIGGASAEPSVPVLRIIAIGMPATYLVATWSFALLALDARNRILVCNAVAFVFAIVLSLLLVPDHGAQGGATTTAALEMTLAVGYGLVLSRLRPGLVPDLRFLVRLGAATVLALGVGAALLAVSPVLATIAGVAVYTVVLAALRAIPPEIAEALRRKVSA